MHHPPHALRFASLALLLLTACIVPPVEPGETTHQTSSSAIAQPQRKTYSTSSGWFFMPYPADWTARGSGSRIPYTADKLALKAGETPDGLTLHETTIASSPFSRDDCAKPSIGECIDDDEPFAFLHVRFSYNRETSLAAWMKTQRYASFALAALRIDETASYHRRTDAFCESEETFTVMPEPHAAYTFTACIHIPASITMSPEEQNERRQLLAMHIKEMIMGFDHRVLLPHGNAGSQSTQTVPPGPSR